VSFNERGVSGTLGIVRPTAGREDELFLLLSADGGITAFNGHVDLGTGIRTALTQIVAEELDVPVERVTMVLGDTARTPDQGATIASETIQVSAVPLRLAAAQARIFLLELAAQRLQTDVARLRTVDGSVRCENGGEQQSVTFEALLEGRSDRLILSTSVPVKPVADYRVVGRNTPRVDIAAKATGGDVYVHDVRLEGMVHGRVVRPPYVGFDSGPFVGTSLIEVDESSLAGLAGILAVVVIRDFVGIVAEREDQAAEAARRLHVKWRPTIGTPDMQDVHAAIGAQPSTARTLLDQGDVDERLESSGTRMPRTYLWPYQLHGSIGPSCAVADFRQHQLQVWSGTQNPIPLRDDLAMLLQMPPTLIEVIRLEAAGCYGRNCADDVAADAALLSRAVGRPVRVQLTREQEHVWEPKGAAQIMEVDGGLAADGTVAAYDFSTRYPSNAAPTLALLLTGTVEPVAAVSDMGDRTAIPPYQFDHMRIVVNDLAPLVRASWLRGVSAMPNTFAHECYVDELAAAAGADPVEFRLRHLRDQRAIELVKEVVQRAGWQVRHGPRLEVVSERRRRGQGVAYAQYIHGKFPGTAAAWSTWVAEVEVDIETGDVQVARVVVGQDTGLAINPSGIQHQIHGNVIQSISRTLKEEVRFDGPLTTNREWGSYPVLRFPELPIIQVVMMARPHEPPLGAGESASVPSAAAISNAIFDAVGVRMREPPFTPERVRAALQAARNPALPPVAQAQATTDPVRSATERVKIGRLDQLRALAAWPAAPGATPWWGRLAAGLIGAASLAAALWVWRAPIAPTAGPNPSLYSAEAVARGRELAALGDCAVCHTSANGVENAGGRALETPFGVVYTTNITPDVISGIGAWSYAAFERAMRRGIHRDGRHLYPAFPYTAFAKTTDRDLEDLYAYLMSQPPVRAPAPTTRLTFPFGWRPLLSFWNALFLSDTALAADPRRSAEWNRGRYLVEGLGHCGACHSPRNALGAEKSGAHAFTGGVADGWEVPALTSVSHAPIPWSETELFDYLKTGSSRFHGVAAGPMQPVIAGLSRLPDNDIRAMAHYLASFNAQLPTNGEQEMSDILQSRIPTNLIPRHEVGARLFEGACASCHDPAFGSLAGIRPSLALNTNLHSDTPTNAIRALLQGVNVESLAHRGSMPSFGASLDDRQIEDVLGYLRARFAPDRPSWRNIGATAARLRESEP
jgi:nicotinate dehydrogenase subunit B